MDTLGTKYITRFFCLALTSIAALPVQAQQSTFVASPGIALPAASSYTGSDSTDPLLTIKKRVDEVNVLFIATDRRGKFVRNLNQNDFDS